MATVHLRAARKSNAFTRLNAAKTAVADALGIEAATGPKLVGAAARDAELVQIAHIENTGEFLETVLGIIQANTVEGDAQSDTRSAETLNEISTILTPFALDLDEGQEPESLAQILYRLISSRAGLLGELQTAATQAAENANKMADLEVKLAESEAKAAKKPK